MVLENACVDLIRVFVCGLCMRQIYTCMCGVYMCMCVFSRLWPGFPFFECTLVTIIAIIVDLVLIDRNADEGQK